MDQLDVVKELLIQILVIPASIQSKRVSFDWRLDCVCSLTKPLTKKKSQGWSLGGSKRMNFQFCDFKCDVTVRPTPYQCTYSTARYAALITLLAEPTAWTEVKVRTWSTLKCKWRKETSPQTLMVKPGSSLGTHNQSFCCDAALRRFGWHVPNPYPQRYKMHYAF